MTTRHTPETETETLQGPRQATVDTRGPALTLTGADRALALQRAIGNRALVRLMQRDTPADVPVAASTGPPYLQDARAGRWEAVAKAIVPLAIGPLLDALEQLRSAGLLATFGLMLATITIDHPARFDAAMLAINTFSAEYRLRALARLHLISDDELAAIQARKRSWFEAGIAPAAGVVMRGSDSAVWGPYQDVKDTKTQCVEGTPDPKFATQRPEEWVKGFLNFYNFQPPPLHDPANSQALFDGGTTTLDVITDRAYEHWLYSMQQLWVPTFNDDGTFFLTEEKIAQLVAGTYQNLRGPAESKNLTFQIIWPATYHANFRQAKAGRDSFVMAQAQVGVTWQMHHDDEPGVEYQGFAQLQFGRYAGDSDTNARLQQIMVGGQAAWVIPLFEKAAQIQFFGQLLGGASNLNSSSAGGGAQVAGGSQFAVNVPGTKGYVQFVAAVQAGATASIPRHGPVSVTGDIGGQAGFVVKILQW